MKEKKTLLHFSQVLLCSLALSHIFMSPTFFSPLSLCLLSPSICLSFALTSCCVHTVQCELFLNEAVSSCSQPMSFPEAGPQLVDCGCTPATLVHKESQKLAPVRETPRKIRQKNTTVAQLRLLQLQMLIGTKTLTTFSLNCYSSFIYFEDVLLGYY